MSAKKKQKYLSKCSRAGVLFPVSRIQRYLRKSVSHKLRISAAAPIYQAAVLEYLTGSVSVLGRVYRQIFYLNKIAEILELAGNAAKDNSRVRITPRHIFLAISNDQELSELLRSVVIPEGGVLPRIIPQCHKPLKSISLSQKQASKPATTASGGEKSSQPKSKAAKSRKGKLKTGLTPKYKSMKKSPASKQSQITTLSQRKLFLGQKLTVIQGDITQVKADALVHPTNSSFSPYGEIGNVLEKVGGPKFVDELNSLRSQMISLASNAVAISPGYNFAAPHVIHVNGPNWSNNQPLEQLEKSVINILNLADDKKLKVIAIPSIGSGKAGFPKQAAAEKILRTISDYFKKVMTSSIKEIIFVLYDRQSVDVYIGELQRLQE